MADERPPSETAADVFSEAMRLLHASFDEADPIQRRRLATDAVLAALAHGDTRARRQVEGLENEKATLRAKVAVLEAEVQELRAANRALRGGR